MGVLIMSPYPSFAPEKRLRARLGIFRSYEKSQPSIKPTVALDLANHAAAAQQQKLLSGEAFSGYKMER